MSLAKNNAFCFLLHFTQHPNLLGTGDVDPTEKRTAHTKCLAAVNINNLRIGAMTAEGRRK